MFLGAVFAYWQPWLPKRTRTVTVTKNFILVMCHSFLCHVIWTNETLENGKLEQRWHSRRRHRGLPRSEGEFHAKSRHRRPLTRSCYQVQEDSPASKAGLQAFFDFIVAVNGTRLDRDNDTLKQMLRNGIGEWNMVLLLKGNSRIFCCPYCIIVVKNWFAFGESGCITQFFRSALS